MSSASPATVALYSLSAGFNKFAMMRAAVAIAGQNYAWQKRHAARSGANWRGRVTRSP